MPYDSNANYIEENNLIKVARVFVVIISFALFFISLFYKCFCSAQYCRSSMESLLLGWLVMLDGGAGLSWLANPLLFVTWVLILNNRKYTLVFSIGAMLMNLSFLGFGDIIDNEGGMHSQIIKISAGYWLWFASCLTAFIGSLVLKIIKSKY
jgi:hypothetical protein